MSTPDDMLDPIVERAPDFESWVGARQSDDEGRDADAVELARLRAVVAAVEALAYDMPTVKHGSYPTEVAYWRGYYGDKLRAALETEVAR